MDYAVDLVLVTYFPDRQRLRKSLLSICGQVRHVILVSNNADDFSDLSMPIEHIDLGSNRGIGFAQNLGIRRAMDACADFVLTSDQDTVYPERYVERLLSDVLSLRAKGRKVAAVGPVFRDENHGGLAHPMVRLGSRELEKFHETDKLSSVSHMISSGMLIAGESLQELGLMREDYFIDWVDTEWCWRALCGGWELFQDPTVHISHELGQKTRNFGYFSVTDHGYRREYFKIRNGILLLLDPCGPRLPIRRYLVFFLLKNLAVNFLRGFRSPVHFKVVLRSVVHGLKGQSGPCEF